MPRVPGPHAGNGGHGGHNGGGNGGGYGAHDPGGPLAPPPHPNGNGDNTGGGGGSGSGGNPYDQGAFDAMYQLLQEYGLSSLAGFLQGLILSGVTDPASIMLALQQTPEWKQRFAGNEMLRAAGLAVLSPAEYLATERAYAQIMHNFGLPQGFYDEPADFAKWIGNNVSAAELQQRVSSYADLMNRGEDPAIKQQLASMGLNEGDLLAMWMDPTRAQPLIQQKYQTALLGAAARRSGVAADNGYLGQLAARGVTEQQAAQGYGMIASSLSDAKTLSSVYGENYGQSDMEAEIFDSNGGAAKKRKRLASQERAAFSGSAGVGSLTQDSAGSY